MDDSTVMVQGWALWPICGRVVTGPPTKYRPVTTNVALPKSVIINHLSQIRIIL